MKLIDFSIKILIAIAIIINSACHREQKTQPMEQPVLMPEKPATTDYNNLPLPKTGEGNFENMVADYESQDRVIWQKPDLVISMLGNLEGKTVADIGAGTGFFTFRMVPKAEKVIGIDIDKRFISFMDSVNVRLPEKFRTRFESRLATANDPFLKTEEADAVTIVNTYGYIENRIAYLKTVSKGMKEEGQLLIIDFKKNNLPVGPSEEYKVALPQLEKELKEAGFVIKTLDKTSLDYQYIVLAIKTKSQTTNSKSSNQ